MTGILVALGAALSFGAADFVGGLAARRRSALVVALVSAAVGAVVFTVLSLAVPGRPSAAAIGWGAASGVASMLAAASLYRALALGPMAVVAPVTATISGAVPVAWAIVSGDRPSVSTVVGLVVVLVGGALVSMAPGPDARRSRGRLQALLLAVVAGVLFGAFYILLAETPDDSATIPLASNRVAGFVVLAVILIGRARTRAPGGVRGDLRSGMLLAVVTAALDATANALYLLAVRQEGDLAVTAVIVSLYPAGTIALAALVDRERISGVQWTGALVAFGGVLMLAI